MRLGVSLAGTLSTALLISVPGIAEAAKVYLRDSVLAVECHWTQGDAVIVTRGGVAMRIPRQDIVQIEEEPAARGECPANAPEPTMTLGGPTPATQPRTASTPIWDPARWERLRLAAKQAKERANVAEAERLCVEALRDVDTSAVKGLYEYVALLQSLKRDAKEARARADKLRDAKSRGSSSVFLGFEPEGDLLAYAALLREAGQGAQAEAMEALAGAYSQGHDAHALRQVEQYRGRDPRGIC